jgi:tight adherence protein B
MKRSLATLAVVAAAAAAQTASAATPPTVDATLATARFPFRSVVLTAPPGVAISAKDVQVTENGQPVTSLSVQSVANAQAGKFGTVLVVDASDSMAGRPIEAAVRAARAFAAHRPSTDALGVVSFNTRVTVALPLTTSQTAINNALTTAPRLKYGTHIYDAVMRGLQMIEDARLTAGTVVLLSDGADTGSKLREPQLVAVARKAHVRLFTVGFRSGAFNPVALKALAGTTGGTFTTATSPKQLEQVYNGLGERLSGEYLVQYRSTAGPNQLVTVRLAIAGAARTAVQYKTPPLPIISVQPFHRSLADRVWGSTLAMIIFALAAALLIGFAMWALLRPPQRSLQRRVAEFVSLYSPRETAKTNVPAVSAVDQSLRRSSRWRQFVESIEIADIAMTPVQIVFLTLVATIFAGFMILALFGSPAFLLFALVVPLASYNGVTGRLARRRRQFSEQLPDTLQVIASALRAGHTLIGALAVVATEAPSPTSDEMKRVVADEQFGVPLDDALDRVAVRMANREFEQVAVVAGLQREAGGNVAEVLDRVADAVRERIELRQLVRSLTAQGRLSRWLLTALPPGLAGIIAFLDPGYLSPLFHKSGGKAILVIAGIMVIIGSLAIKKIVEIDV